MFFSLVLLSTLSAEPEDYRQSLEQIYKHRAEQNVMMRATVNRDEFKNGKTSKYRSNVEFCAFQENIYCMNDKVQDGKKYQHKICRSCFPDDKTIMSTVDDSSKMNYTVMDKVTSTKSKQIFEFRWVGYFTLPYEGVTPDIGSPFAGGVYEKPFLNQELETAGQRCIQFNAKENLGYLRFFVSKNIKRIHKIEIENKTFSTKMITESFYRNEVDLFPYKVLAHQTTGENRLIEQIDITEWTPVLNKDPQFWNPALVGFHENIYVGNIVDEFGKSRGEVNFYDGKTLRKATESELKPPGEMKDKPEVQKSNDVPIKKTNEWYYTIPVALLAVVLFFMIRYFVLQRKNEK